MDVLSRFDERVAAGLLARAALALEDSGNPAAQPIVENEFQIRASLIDEAAKRFGIDPRVHDPAAIERIGAYFDEQSEKLSGSPDIDSAVTRLVSTGHLPSDVYEINLISNIKESLGSRYRREESLILRTIREPDREQHFGPPKSPKEPYLISLFARRFVTPYPFKDFTMLVAGQRGEGKKLDVHFAWRLYDSKVQQTNAESLVELLRRFSDVYGVEIKLNDVKGKFFLTSPSLAPNKILLEGPKGRTLEFQITQFAQPIPGTTGSRAALIVAIDLDNYRRTYDQLDTPLIF